MLFLLRVIVTLTDSSRYANSAGEGRKSGTILIPPNGSSVYFIFVLIDRLAFPPVAGSEYANDVVPIGKAYGNNAISYFAKTVVTNFFVAVAHVFSDDTMRVGEGVLGHRKRDSVFFSVLLILFGVPFKMRFCHNLTLSEMTAIYHIFIWLFLWLT